MSRMRTFLACQCTLASLHRTASVHVVPTVLIRRRAPVVLPGNACPHLLWLAASSPLQILSCVSPAGSETVHGNNACRRGHGTSSRNCGDSEAHTHIRARAHGRREHSRSRSPTPARDQGARTRPRRGTRGADPNSDSGGTFEGTAGRRQGTPESSGSGHEPYSGSRDGSPLHANRRGSPGNRDARQPGHVAPAARGARRSRTRSASPPRMARPRGRPGGAPLSTRAAERPCQLQQAPRAAAQHSRQADTGARARRRRSVSGDGRAYSSDRSGGSGDGSRSPVAPGQRQLGKRVVDTGGGVMRDPRQGGAAAPRPVDTTADEEWDFDAELHSRLRKVPRRGRGGVGTRIFDTGTAPARARGSVLTVSPGGC